MGHVHTESNSYALTRVSDQIILMSLSGVCLECRLRIQPLVCYNISISFHVLNYNITGTKIKVSYSKNFFKR